ncbi:hypothetical protein AArcSl_3172 [Halalkaliarchaeum desulfuricum]|uniref:PGF-CTERM sorting domain-containing protein n=1 Tax=Halalkaliarchaeum desulfuricum TaxID=2055893 RepID=A0A343TNV6_9EURY|nr:Hvo_1808 family surface protein [Halalkaliarchaeum desulfuricum]AUX10778.1 hypothetical protein AArcSl_3172 [Halalkaliarchaeum desulfuricum]
MGRVLTLAVALLMVTAMFAPVAAAAPPGTVDDVATASSTNDHVEASGAPVSTFDTDDADNETDEDEFGDEPIGKVNGYWYNDSIDIDQADGLTDEELEAYVYRKMARVEQIRDQKFRADVPVDVMTREEFREMREDRESDEEFNRWNDQVWKGLFIVGEDESSEEEIDTVFSGAVAGFYSPAEDRVVIVTDDGDNPVIDNSTLLHELGHAMQDQYHNLSDPTYRGATQDADLAIDGIVEGEVVYMEHVYEERCESGEWECVETPPTDRTDDDGPDPNLGIFLTVFQPYSDGPGYAADIVEEDGWEGITERMEEPPKSTTQVIHRTDREPTPIDYEHTAESGWEHYPDQGVEGADTVGEASIYAMFWYQARFYEADTIDWREFTQADHPHETYNYVSEPSSGWANDELYPYRRGDDQDGYVWVTEWETATDAQQFSDAYGAMLEAHDVRTDDGYHVVDDGPFRGAYLVSTEDTRVTIVHGPTTGAVSDIRPDLAAEIRDDATTEPDDPGEIETPTEPDAPDAPDDDGSIDLETPGFGAGIAVAALLATIALLRVGRRR